MNIKTVETMSKVSQKIALIKNIVANALAETHPEKYMEIRELLNDCQEIMAIHCDTAPINLINGNVEKIINNHVVRETFSSTSYKR